VSAMQRRKGATAEVAFVNWLRSIGWDDARRYLAGDGRQPGDIDGIPGVCLEVKNCAELRIPAWLRQVEAEAGRNLPVLIVKPRGVSDPARWWAIVTAGDMFGDLLGPPGAA
jgi:hypothetical protein